MHIAVDLRSLQSGHLSGVENYTLNLLEHLLTLDKKNRYTLFYNAARSVPIQDFHFVNAEVVRTRVPNRLLNAALKCGVKSLEDFVGDFDAFFMPNLNQYNIRPHKKLAVTVHDLSPVVTPEFYDFKRRLWHRFLGYRQAFARADLLFAVSQHTKNDLQKLFGVPEHKIKVAYPGIDREVFKPTLSESELRGVRNKYDLPGHYILFLSTIEPRKNLVNLIRAFDLVRSNVHLVIAGRKGWKYGSIFKHISASKKRKKIHYKGYVAEEDKAALLRLSQAVVYPSFYEGFGFVPLEAASCGVPVVVGNVTSLPEVMQDSALLVNPYSINELAIGVEQAVHNQDLRRMLIRKGLARVADFSWQKTAQSVLEGLNAL